MICLAVKEAVNMVKSTGVSDACMIAVALTRLETLLLYVIPVVFLFHFAGLVLSQSGTFG